LHNSLVWITEYITIEISKIRSLVESVEGLLRNVDRGNKVDDLRDGFLLVGEVSEEGIEKSLDSIPTGELGGEVFLSDGEISLSLLSEGFGVGDILDALSMGGSVVDDSLSGLINSLLGDSHEVGVGGKLVSFSSHGIGDTLDHLSSDGGELLSESTEHLGVGEIGELEESLHHGTPLGMSKSVLNFLERSLDLGDLDHGGGTGVETGKELNALIDGVNGKVGFFNPSGVLGVRLSSLNGSGVHSGESVNNELLISGNLGLEGSLKWVEDVLKFGGGLGDIRLGGGDSLSDGGFPFVVLSQLDVVVLSVNINLELVVSHEVLEGLDQVTDW